MESIKKIIEDNKQKNKSVGVGKNGGVRPGAGRPVGSMNKATRDKKEAESYFKQRIINSIDKLITSQMNLAQGCQMLFRIKHTKGKNGIEIKSKPELVTNQKEIAKYLAGDLEESEENGAYYFITTERPDNRALDSLVDRVFGKAKQNVAVEGSLTISQLISKLTEDEEEITTTEQGLEDGESLQDS